MSGKSKDNEAEKTEDMTIEQSFDYLDGVLDRLGDDDISLEDSFRLYEQGMRVLKECSGKIDTVEKKVLELNGEGVVQGEMG